MVKPISFSEAESAGSDDARGDAIADATIIPAPLSVKNEAKARDPQRQQTKKGK